MQSIGFVDGIKQKDAFEFVLMALGSGNIPGESVPGRARKENLYSYLAQLLPLEHVDLQSYPSDAEKDNHRPRWERFVDFAVSHQLAKQGWIEPTKRRVAENKTHPSTAGHEPVHENLVILTEQGWAQYHVILKRWALNRFARLTAEAHGWDGRP